MKPWQRWNDKRLALGVRAGDRQAGDRLVAVYYRDVYRWLLRLTGHRQEAEDLTQETFLQVIRDLDSFRGECTLRTWIHRLAYHTYLRLRRTSTATGSPVPEDCPDGEAHLESTVMTRRLVHDALARLSVEHRQVAVLYYLQELTVAEIASVLGVPVGTVKSRLHYARLQLRDLLAEQAHSHPEEEVKSHVVQER